MDRTPVVSTTQPPQETSPVDVDPMLERFASGSVTVHIIRGVAGLVFAVLAVALAGTHAWAPLGLIPALVLWRGCPTCWMLGLGHTLSRGRVGGCGTCD